MRTLPFLLPVLLLASCASAYYATMEKLGVHKRELLVDRVERGREEQAEASEQFQTTLEVFQELTGFEGGELAAVHGRLEDEYEEAERRANAVTARVEAIEDVAAALFDEWQDEIGELTSEDLRERSAELREDTMERYGVLIEKMRAAESRMGPVLDSFRDRVLFLKHNLNARAIASLADTAVEIEDDVADLVRDMQAAVAEADAFLAAMEE